MYCLNDNCTAEEVDDSVCDDSSNSTEVRGCVQHSSVQWSSDNVVTLTNFTGDTTDQCTHRCEDNAPLGLAFTR